MTSSFGALQRGAAVAIALCVSVLSGCKDPVAVKDGAVMDTAVLSKAGTRALSGSYTVDTLTLETRYWARGSALPTSATAAAAFDALPTNVSGYTNTPWLMPDLAAKPAGFYQGLSYVDTNWTGISNPAGAHANVATRYHASINARTASVLSVEFGVDFLGGAMFVDGVPVAEDWNNPWWKGEWRYDSNSYAGCKTFRQPPCVPIWVPNTGVFSATVTLAAGRHVVEVIGFENGDDAGAAARIDAGTGYQPMVAAVQPAQVLTVTPTAGGTVSSTPAGLSCPGTCTASFPLSSTVTLTAAVNANYVFTGWTGDCSGTGACTVSMYLPRNVSANFAALPSVTGMTIETRYWDLTSFTRSSAGALAFFNALPTNVSGYTNEPVPVTTLVRNPALFTAPNSGAGLKLASRYLITMNATTATTASFRFGGDMGFGGTMLLDNAEVASFWGNGTSGTALLATATLTPGEHVITVVGFEDCCEGYNPTFEYNVGNGWVTAVAPALPAIPLTIAVPNAGGRIVSAPAGIDCGAVCQASFATGSQVTLTATPDTYFGFTGWGGQCTGTGPCVVRMLAPSRSVTANFARTAWPVSVVTGGAGAGTVSMSPQGTSCGANCWAFAPGTVVTFTATPNATSSFGGWSVAGCSTAACTITVNSALNLTATFTVPLVQLTVTPAAGGTITSSPAGIACGDSCIASFPKGSVVALTATPSVGYAFAGWTGACSGTGACSVSMGAAATVGAIFTKVADSTPPTVTCSADPKTLWPVNHKLVDITVKVTVADAGSGPAGFVLDSVRANEPVNTTGDGNTLPDIVGWTIGTADVSGQLRAERRGDDKDRIYTLFYSGFDKAGYRTVASCAVTVPHDQRDK